MVTFREYNEINRIIEFKKLAKITEQANNQLLNEGLISTVLYGLAQIVDPTGVLSWPDFIRAIKEADFSSKIKGTITTVRVLGTLYMCIPNLGLLIGAGAGAAAGGVGAAPGAAIGGVGWAGLKTIVKALASSASAKAASKIPMFYKALQSIEPKMISFLQNGLVGKTIRDALAQALSKKIISKQNYGDASKLLAKISGKRFLLPSNPKMLVRAAGALMPDTGKAAAEEIKRKLDPYRTPEGQRLTVPGQPTGGTQTAQASVGAQQEPQETLTYTDPKTGQQFQGTADEFRSLGILPIQAPQQQSYPFAGTGVQLTPAQQQAIGGFIPRGGTQRTGQIVPQNVPQGATQQNPFGREGMSPSEYMTPDNFNNPPVPQPNQRGYSPNQQQYGLGNLVGDVGNTVAGTVGGLGALAGQLAATPIAGVTNLASGLLGLIPGIGGSTGMGMNPYQMAPQGYNPNQYYRSPQGYNPYNYPPYGYPQR